MNHQQANEEKEIRDDAQRRFRAEWLSISLTKELQEKLETAYEDIKESFARGEYLDHENPQASMLKNAAAVAELNIIRRLLIYIKDGE